jgi:SAM-dependent methyltransferase
VARYTFGDDEAAVDRLGLVAAAYERTSLAFLVGNVPDRAGVALDLGCGPGLSTRLLGEACAPTVLIGIDSSPQFLGTARAMVPEATFVVHDVTTVPLPGGPADVIYARLLLAHLPAPLGVAGRWAAQLRAGGVLLLEDLDHTDAPSGPLRTYDEVSTEIVRRGGGLMYAGAALEPLGGLCAAVTVPASTAARIYLFNVRRWRADLALASLAPVLAEIEDGLEALLDDDGASVSWVVRQVAIRG